MAIPFSPYTFTDGVPNDFNAARANAISLAVRDAQLMPTARVVSNANQSIGSGLVTQVALNFQTETWDQASGSASTQHDNVTNNTRLTALYAGIYDVSMWCQFAPNGTGLRYLLPRKNGTTNYGAAFAAGNASDNYLNIAVLIDLGVNDYVEATVLQNSGGALNVNAGAVLSFVRVG